MVYPWLYYQLDMPGNSLVEAAPEAWTITLLASFYATEQQLCFKHPLINLGTASTFIFVDCTVMTPVELWGVAQVNNKNKTSSTCVILLDSPKIAQCIPSLRSNLRTTVEGCEERLFFCTCCSISGCVINSIQPAYRCQCSGGYIIHTRATLAQAINDKPNRPMSLCFF